VARRLSCVKLLRSRYLPSRPELQNSLTPSRIFFANTRYACSASTCVAKVFSRFIHILRYLSAPRSFNAAYHPFLLVCLHTTAKFLPPSPVTPLTCLRHAALSSEISSEGASSSDDEEEEEELEACMREKKLERMGVDGTDLLDVFEGVLFLEDEAVFEDSVREGLGRDGVSFSFSFSASFSFEDLCFLLGVSDDFEGSDDLVFGDFGDFGGSVLDRDSFGGAASGNAPICVADLVGAAGFDDEAFTGVGFGAASLVDVGFAGATFGDGGFAAEDLDVGFGIETFGGGSLT
jgi:hypothetical protein